MVHVNETIVIKSSSPKMAEWVKKLKRHKEEQLEKLRNIEKCDFEFKFWFIIIMMFLYVLSKHQLNTSPLALFPPIFYFIFIFFSSDLHFSKNNRTFALEDAIVR